MHTELSQAKSDRDRLHAQVEMRSICTDDGAPAIPGMDVWINHCRRMKPTPAKLIEIRLRADDDRMRDLPWLVEVEGGTWLWAHIYSTWEAAEAADKDPTKQRSLPKFSQRDAWKKEYEPDATTKQIEYLQGRLEAQTNYRLGIQEELSKTHQELSAHRWAWNGRNQPVTSTVIVDQTCVTKDLSGGAPASDKDEHGYYRAPAVIEAAGESAWDERGNPTHYVLGYLAGGYNRMFVRECDNLKMRLRTASLIESVLDQETILRLAHQCRQQYRENSADKEVLPWEMATST